MKAHKRGQNYRPTTTIVFDDKVLTDVDDYQSKRRKDNRSQAVNELIRKGLKYVALEEKKRAKMSS